MFGFKFCSTYVVHKDFADSVGVLNKMKRILMGEISVRLHNSC